MAEITFRQSTTPTVPGATTAKGTELTFDELDGNFKSIVNDLASKATAASVADQAIAMAIALG